jgi:hypothetical protein
MIQNETNGGPSGWRGTAMDAEATPPATHANRSARASAGGLNIEDLSAALVRSQAS